MYGWLRVIAHGGYQAGSWQQVDAALMGELGEPPADVRAPTMAERWAERVADVEDMLSS